MIDIGHRAVHPVSKQTLQAHVYQELRRLLMSGHLVSGQELRVRDLAVQFGTSVQPVREAILQLIAEKALEPCQKASARVPVLDRARLIDLRNVRIGVEGLAAELATPLITDEEIDALADIVAVEIAADDARRADASVRQNRDFHFRLYQASGSAILPSIIEGLWLQVGPIIRQAAEVFDATDGRGGQHHLATIQALRKRDALQVRASLEDDIRMFFDVALSVHM